MSGVSSDSLRRKWNALKPLCVDYNPTCTTVYEAKRQMEEAVTAACGKLTELFQAKQQLHEKDRRIAELEEEIINMRGHIVAMENTDGD